MYRNKAMRKQKLNVDPAKLQDRIYRISNLYRIQTKEGTVVDFRPYPSQKKFLNNLWYRNIIEKSRQQGYSTVIDIMGLDTCLFCPLTTAVLIVQNEDAAKKLFGRVVKFAYDNLHPDIKALFPLAEKPSQTNLTWENGSSFSVSLGARSGTCQWVHVSEYGPIGYYYPHKSSEILAGTLETVPRDGFVAIESTPKGDENDFARMAIKAYNEQRQKKRLTPLSYHFHFAPWYVDPTFTLSDRDAEGIIINQQMQEYFAELEASQGITLTAGQKAYYVQKRDTLGDLILSEYPSTPEEGFRGTLTGIIFCQQMQTIRTTGRIGKYKPYPGWPVETWWDLGMDDLLCIWFTQTVGNQIMLIDYYENHGKGFDHYADYLRDRGYVYSSHNAPHDIKVRELMSGKSRIEEAKKFGIWFRMVPRVAHKIDAINAARRIFPAVYIDEEACALGIEHLDKYRWEWDQKRGRWKDTPYHDIHSNGADAFMTLAGGHQFGATGMANMMATTGGY